MPNLEPATDTDAGADADAGETVEEVQPDDAADLADAMAGASLKYDNVCLFVQNAWLKALSHASDGPPPLDLYFENPNPPNPLPHHKGKWHVIGNGFRTGIAHTWYVERALIEN